MQNLKKAALALCLAACVSVGFVDNAYAEEVMPSSGVAYEDLDREINRLEFVISSDKHNWESVSDLSLLYYDRGEYKKCYNMSKRTLKLFEDGYGYNDDDIVRESLVKGAAAAYNIGKYSDCERMLKKMISLNLRGSEENEKTFMGWAYYYLSNIERIRGNYDRSHFYGNICLHYYPGYHVFVDYWDGFIRIDGFWRWRHHHHHNYRPPMPPPRHHWRDHHPRHDVKPRPDFHNHRPHQDKPAIHKVSYDHNRRDVKRVPEHRGEIRKQDTARHDIKRPGEHRVHPENKMQKRADNITVQPKPNAERSQVNRPIEQRGAQVERHQSQKPQVQRHTEQRPVYQPKQQGSVQRPSQRPVYQPRPQGQSKRPVYQPRPQGQSQRPVYQPRPQGQSQRPVYQPRPQGQSQRPVYQPRPQGQSQRPVYQPRPQGQSQRPAQRTQGGHAPQGHQRRR